MCFLCPYGITINHDNLYFKINNMTFGPVCSKFMKKEFDEAKKKVNR